MNKEKAKNLQRWLDERYSVETEIVEDFTFDEGGDREFALHIKPWAVITTAALALIERRNARLIVTEDETGKQITGVFDDPPDRGRNPMARKEKI